MNDHSPYGAFLTYDARRCQDGLGAQLQRILGIYGIAQALGVGYFHTGFTNIEANPGDPNTSEPERLLLLHRANALADLPSDLSSRAWYLPGIQRMDWSRAARIIDAHKIARRLRQRVVFPLATPYPWADRHPEIYLEGARQIASRIDSGDCATEFRIDVHIRRALAPSIPGTVLSQRFVPTEWYEKVLAELVVQLEGDARSLEIRVHTDIPEGQWDATAGLSPATRTLLEADGLMDNDGYLRKHWQDLDDLLEVLPGVRICREWDPIEAMSSMVTSDILVTCPSSFSFVAGLLRGENPVISPRFWHNAPPSWLVLPRDLDSWDLEQVGELISRSADKGTTEPM